MESQAYKKVYTEWIEKNYEQLIGMCSTRSLYSILERLGLYPEDLLADILLPKIYSLPEESLDNLPYSMTILRNEIRRRILDYIEEKVPDEQLPYQLTEKMVRDFDQKPANRPSMYIEGRPDWSALNEIRDRLTPLQWEVILQKDGQGKTFREIAEDLNYSSHTSVIYQYQQAWARVTEQIDKP